MKRLIVLVLLALLLSVAGAQAANLQAGWYVRLGLTDVRGFDGGATMIIDWEFVGPLGNSGPFLVTSPDPVYGKRMVSVPVATDAPAGTHIDLWGRPLQPVAFPITGVVPLYDTQYDSSRMRLQLFMYNSGTGFTLLWEQKRSGAWGDASNVLMSSQVIPVGSEPVFRIAVVPEPSQSAILLTGCAVMLVTTRRRLSHQLEQRDLG